MMLSDNLIEARRGIFTASENHRLMAGWDTPKPTRDFDEFANMYEVLKPFYQAGVRKFLVGDLKEKFEFKISTDLINKTMAVIKAEKPPEGLITYAQEKAIETFFDNDPSLQFSTVHTRNGEEREPEAMRLLAEATGLTFDNIGENQQHIITGDAGCTPDGVVMNDLDLFETGAEVKCKTPLEHAKNLLINTQEELLKHSIQHYTQVQTQMLVTDTDYWYFANYNPFAINDKLKFKHIIIYRHPEFIAVLKDRIETAAEIRDAFIEKIKKTL
tara:strand:+ start:931 stop:1746 length:816 start_codon:yes stop_codon:yes gene_type:complete